MAGSPSLLRDCRGREGRMRLQWQERGEMGNRRRAALPAVLARMSLIALCLLLFCSIAAATMSGKKGLRGLKRKAPRSKAAPRTIRESAPIYAVFVYSMISPTPSIHTLSKGIITWDPPNEDFLIEITRKLSNEAVSLRVMTSNQLHLFIPLLLAHLTEIFGVRDQAGKLTSQSKIIFHQYNTFKLPFSAFLSSQINNPASPVPDLHKMEEELLQYQLGETTHEAFPLHLQTWKSGLRKLGSGYLLNAMTIRIKKREVVAGTETSSPRASKETASSGYAVVDQDPSGRWRETAGLITGPLQIRYDGTALELSPGRRFPANGSPLVRFPALGGEFVMFVTTQAVPAFGAPREKFYVIMRHPIFITPGPRLSIEEKSHIPHLKRLKFKTLSAADEW